MIQLESGTTVAQAGDCAAQLEHRERHFSIRRFLGSKVQYLKKINTNKMSLPYYFIIIRRRRAG